MNNKEKLKARVRVLTKRDRIAQARQQPLATQLRISTLLCAAKAAYEVAN